MQIKPILYLSPLPPPRGGMATWTESIFATGLPDNSPLTLVDTKILGTRAIFARAPFSFVEIIRSVFILKNYLQQLIQQRPCLIHLNFSLSTTGIFRDLLMVSLAKLFNIRLICHYHGDITHFNREQYFGFSGYALKALIKCADSHIVMNQASLAFLTQQNAGSIKFLPNFVQDKLLALNTAYPYLQQHSRLRVIFAGGITRAKGVLDILQLAITLPEIDFYLYGKLHSDVSDAFTQAPKNIFLHETLSQECLFVEMCHSDLLLFPSHSEGFPFTVLEAMAIGLPIIATRVGAIPEMIDNLQGGFLIDSQQKMVAMQNALHYFLQKPIQLKKMGQHNKQKCFEYYRYSHVIKELQSIYHAQLKDKTSCVA